MIEHKNNKFIANFDNINSITEILSQNLSIFEKISLILKKDNYLFNGKDLISLNFIIFINLLFIMISQCSYYMIINTKIRMNLINFLDIKLFLF